MNSKTKEIILRKRKEDFDTLKSIIFTLLGVDIITSKRRFRHIVNAKMIYSYLLHKQGYGCSVISKSIDMNHATVLHYYRTMENYMKTDFELVRNYELCKKACYGKADPVDYLSTIELKKEVLVLRQENTVMLFKLNAEKDKDERLKVLYDIIRERTKEGHEKEMAVKLTRLYN
mgnify:FL=1